MDYYDLKSFVQSIHNKISIAVALALVKSTPSHISPQEYVEILQGRVLQDWLKGNDSSIFDGKILEFQQGKIFNQITDLLLTPASNNDSKDLEIPDICADFDWDDCFPETSESGSESDGANNLKNNINFVEVMVQLKYAVESSKTLSVPEIKSFIQGTKCNLPEKIGGEIVLSKQQFSEDSGFGGSHSLLPHPHQHSTVPSSIIRFVTHSMKTDALINKSIKRLLADTRHWLVSEPRERFTLWKGSVLEHLTSVLKSTASNPLCTSAVSDFVIKFLDEIWSSELTGQHEVWEYQIAILSEFCYNKYIIEAVISNIMQKIDILSVKLSSEDIYSSDKLHELFLIEQAPFFLNMLKRLLNTWQVIRKSSVKNCEKSTTVTSITELWKKNSTKETCGSVDKKKAGNVTSNEDTYMINAWLIICEKLVTSSTKLFPLISFEAWEVLELLNSSHS